MKFGGGPQQSFDFFLGTKTNFHFEWKLQLILHLELSYFCSAHAQLAQYEACSVFAGHGFRLTEYVLSFSARFDVKTCNFHKVVPLSKSFITKETSKYFWRISKWCKKKSDLFGELALTSNTLRHMYLTSDNTNRINLKI